MTATSATPSRSTAATELEDWSLVEQGIEAVLPLALVTAASDAQEMLHSSFESTSTTPSLAQLDSAVAAALGGAAVSTVAHMLTVWVRRRRAQLDHAALPVWLKPKTDASTTVHVQTLTSFSQHRTQMVKHVEDGSVVVLTRRGKAVAAVVPLQEGVYENEVTSAALRRVLTQSSPASPDNETLARILERDGQEAAAAAAGVDTSSWAALNPPAAETHGEGGNDLPIGVQDRASDRPAES